MKDQSNEFENHYPTKDFAKTIYAFDSAEIRKLTSMDTIVQLGQMAQLGINQIVNEEFLPRIGAKKSPDIGVLYDIPKGQCMVFTPKVWCAACKNKKADYEYKGRFYCGSCLKLQQEVDAGKKVKEAKKEALKN